MIIQNKGVQKICKTFENSSHEISKRSKAKVEAACTQLGAPMQKMPYVYTCVRVNMSGHRPGFHSVHMVEIVSVPRHEMGSQQILKIGQLVYFRAICLGNVKSNSKGGSFCQN